MQSYLSGRQSFDPGSPSRQEDQPISALAKVSHSRSKPSAHADHGRPEIECVRQGNRVSRIIVKCACGDVIEIDCVYQDQT